MSNSFYHKDLTEAQWNRIKFVFEEKPKVGRPPLNFRTVFNALKCYGVELGGKKILADKAYSSEQIRFFVAEHGAVACIPDISFYSLLMLFTFNLPTTLGNEEFF
ncbi:MAG: hypothetical protein IKO05_01305 [Selenomonadaceae bacterium]|nr:hypothetical protein [Selenomonadaceae bacterium]